MQLQSNDLVHERLPNGELAWLRLDPRRVRIVENLSAPHPDPDARFDLTDAGRRALAMERLFGPWPVTTETSCAAKASTCPACHQPQTAPSCAQREHYGC